MVVKIDGQLRKPKLEDNIKFFTNQFSANICNDHPNVFLGNKKTYSYSSIWGKFWWKTNSYKDKTMANESWIFKYE